MNEDYKRLDEYIPAEGGHTDASSAEGSVISVLDEMTNKELAGSLARTAIHAMVQGMPGLGAMLTVAGD